MSRSLTPNSSVFENFEKVPEEEEEKSKLNDNKMPPRKRSSLMNKYKKSNNILTITHNTTGQITSAKKRSAKLFFEMNKAELDKLNKLYVKEDEKKE